MADTETEPTEVTIPPYLRRLTQDGAEWYGCLTLENAELVAARIRRLLDSSRYSWAFETGHEGEIELHTSAAAENIRADVRADHAFVTWSDGWSHQLYTTIRDRREEVQLSYEEKRSNGIWLHFHGEQFTTDSYAIAGNRCRGTFRIEVPDE